MKKWMALVPALALVAALMVGCGGGEEKKEEKKSSENNTPSAETTNASLPAMVCGQCGQEAGDECCSSGEKCEKCEFVSGSVLCCKGVEKIDGAYCTACGEVAKSDACCSEDAEKCECGMNKGSGLCCKMEEKEKSAD